MAKYFLHTLPPNPNDELNILPTDAARFWRKLTTLNLPKDEIFSVIFMKKDGHKLYRWIAKQITIEDLVVVLKEFQRGIYSNATNVKAHTN